jgi:ABC-type branched-subunit amino acid transport system ATPase component
MWAYGGLAMHEGTAGVAPGEIAGVIGLKGAGKMMLFNRIADSKPPLPVRVRFDREEVMGRPALGSGARAPAHEAAGFGSACTFHIPALFPLMTASQKSAWPPAALTASAGGMPCPFAEGGNRERGERAGSGSTDLIARRPRRPTRF